jgi:hypothetical protein
MNQGGKQEQEASAGTNRQQTFLLPSSSDLIGHAYTDLKK